MPPTQPKMDMMDNFINPVGVDFMRRGQDIVNSIQSGAKAYQDAQTGKMNPIEAGFRLGGTGIQTAGSVAGGALDILKSGVNTFAQPIAQKFVDSPLGNVITSNKYVQKIAGKVDDVADAYKAFSKKHPEINKDIAAGANILNLLLTNQAFKSAIPNPPKGGLSITDVTDRVKNMTPSEVKNIISHSEAFDVKGSIDSGAVPREIVYQGDTNTLTPEFAQGRVADIAEKLEAYRPGLGDTFFKDVIGVDPSQVTNFKVPLEYLKNITMEGNVPEDLVNSANQLIDSVASTVNKPPTVPPTNIK